MSDNIDDLNSLITRVTVAYVEGNRIGASDVPVAIAQIASGFRALGTGQAIAAAPEPARRRGRPPGRRPAAAPVVHTPRQPRVAPVVLDPNRPKPTPAEIRASITDAALISFEDGKPYRALKTHLSRRGLTLAQYREKWGLPSDYPAASMDYAKGTGREDGD